MRYRKKPVEIEAVPVSMFMDAILLQEWGENLPDWGRKALETGIVSPSGDWTYALAIQTLEGSHHANHGDMIIRGVKGELYPCKPDIFEATYESVEEN